MRFSIGRLMILVVIGAANFAAVRLVAGASPGFFIELLLLGAMPMLDVLIVAHWFRMPGRRFLSGFIAAGWVVLASFVLISAAFPEPLDRELNRVIGSIFGAGPFSMLMLPAYFLALFAFYSMPQILIAAFVGWLHGEYRVRLLIERRPGPAGSAPTA